MKNLKELTILHSNDMHGDFLAEQIDENLVGGVSLLSGYVNMVRRQEKMYFMPLILISQYSSLTSASRRIKNWPPCWIRPGVWTLLSADIHIHFWKSLCL